MQRASATALAVAGGQPAVRGIGCTHRDSVAVPRRDIPWTQVSVRNGAARTPPARRPGLARFGALLVAVLLLSLPATARSEPVSQRSNDLDGLWNFFKYSHVDSGRVISHDEGGITTSEGQGYGMLRAVWSGDRETFESIWRWTGTNLSRHDRLFSWKWRNRVIDENAATDADTDIALALLLAAERFARPEYKRQAIRMLDDIWEKEVLDLHGRRYVTAGNWAPGEEYPTVHVGYLAPYAYEVFAEADPDRPWRDLVSSSYAVLEWIFIHRRFSLPPEKIYIDRKTGDFLLQRPGRRDAPRFSYDAFPIYWRVATDYQWFGRDKPRLRAAMLRFFEDEWQRRGRFYDNYSPTGKPASELEGLPLYATVAALAREENSQLAERLEAQKLSVLWQKALSGEDTPYYLHNWLWFDRALELKRARHFGEFLSFLYPFDVALFKRHLPLELLITFLLLAFLCAYSPLRENAVSRTAMLIVGLLICGRYLLWRAEHSLNFVEPVGPFISITLLAAEFYCFSTVVLLLLQVGLASPRSHRTERAAEFAPPVDIFVPIYSESLVILEKTLIAAQSMHYRNKTVYVCDDSHRESVAALADALGAVYVRGPKRHAKAGNINNALAQSTGELAVIFDTDHIPVRTFLDETVPFFSDPQMGFVQTAHHFYNSDIFQAALGTGEAVPNEQDVFHHAIQSARNNWGGAFFVGTGAVFRRKALEDVGGLLLMSITEDIHTSQHLHAKGWKSQYVAKNLAVGLNAENLSSYLVQRTRWMQGCLQVFFKDNPLFTRGLPARHRLGYFASQYYFFFPLARMVFLAAPLCFLLFHWHPIFSDLETLLAYLIPFMICLPILSQSLLPGWPRLIWASAYENTIAVPLFRAMFDLLLPKKLAFKVTPKGISSERSVYDFRSCRYSLIAFAITLVAIVKGLGEFYFFGIERDAYFFNLAWASVNLIMLITPLLLAYEHPRAQHQQRIKKRVPVTLAADGFSFKGESFDLDETGMSVLLADASEVSGPVVVSLSASDTLTATGTVCYHDRDERGRARLGIRFDPLTREARRWILLNVFADPGTWESKVERRSRSNLMMAYYFCHGLLRAMRPPHDLRRMQPRARVLDLVRAHGSRIAGWALVTNRAGRGLGAYTVGARPRAGIVSVACSDGLQPFRIVHARCLLPGVWRLGLAQVAQAAIGDEARDAA